MGDRMDNNLILPDPRPIRADAVKNRALLLDTAQRLFAQNGVEAVTMSEVAEAAGVGKGTLYRHFANKVELCQVLIDEDQRDFQNRALARLRQRGDVRTDLEWYVGEVIAFIVRNQEILFTIASDTSLYHPAHRWWRQTIRGLLQQLHPVVDVEYAADLIFVMLNPRTIQFQMEIHGYSAVHIGANLIRVLDSLLD